eukprot:g46458.t1
MPVAMTATGISESSVQSLTSGTNESARDKPDSAALDEVVAKLKQLQIESSPSPGTNPKINLTMNLNGQEDTVKLLDRDLKNTVDTICPTLSEGVKSNIVKAQPEVAVKGPRDDTRLNEKISNLFDAAFGGPETTDTILFTSKIPERPGARGPLKPIPVGTPFNLDDLIEKETVPNSEIPTIPLTSVPIDAPSDFPALK